MKRFVAVLMALTLVFTLAACSEDGHITLTGGKGNSKSPTGSTAPESVTPADFDFGELSAEVNALIVQLQTQAPATDKKPGFQLEAPKEGELIAVFDTSMGSIKARLFPEVAPVSVANFLALIGKKYYDGIIFHRVSKDFVVQGGDPTATGMGGEKGVKRSFEGTPNLQTFPLRGALSYAHSGKPAEATSQFFIIQRIKPADNVLTSVNMLETDGRYPKGITQLYREHGGTPELDGTFNSQNTFITFGQVFEGMDAVDKMNNVAVTPGTIGPNDGKPVQDITINSVRVAKYTK